MPLILRSALMKIASTSATVMHNIIKIGRSNLNHVNEFVSVTKFTKKNEISEKMKTQSTLSKILRRSEEITASCFSSVFERSIE